MTLSAVFLALGSALLGLAAGLGWSRRGLAFGRRGCVALLIIDRPVGRLGGHLSRQAAQRLRDRVEDVLRRALPPGAVLERRDIDRFLLTTTDPSVAALAKTLTETRAAVSRTFLALPDGAIQCTMSAGIVRIRPGEDMASAVVRAAKVAANVRERGGDRVATEDDEPLGSVEDLSREIQAALAAGELRYDLQPIRDLRSGRDVGAEALLRWRKTSGAGIGDLAVAPAHVSDVLDQLPERGATDIARMLVDAAAPVLAQPDTYVTVNISGAVLDGSGSAAGRWLQALLDLLPPERLVVEIVEYAVFARPDRAYDLIDRLRDRGVRVALDDFGTGLSNLERLVALRIDILKVDRSFTAGLCGDGREATILRHLAAMADEMGVALVAEGVESEEQAEALRALGIRFAQGYLFGRPMLAKDWRGRGGKGGQTGATPA